MKAGVRIFALSVGVTVGSSVVLCAQCPDGSPPPCRAQPARAAPAPAPNSVAVLYFDNLSPDSADAYLADGLTEEISSRLADVQRLQIKRSSRAATQRLRDSVPDYLVAIGRVLRVRHLVEGSLRRAGSRVRVSVHLVKAEDGFRVWGQDYDRTTADLLALQEEIAREVAVTIAGQLAPRERAALAVRPTRDLAAYDHYLRGNFHLARRTMRAMRQAINEYEAAVRLDPRFTAAHARIAYSYALLLWIGWHVPGLEPDSLLARGFVAADHALAQDSSNSDAWMARGFLLCSQPHATCEGALPALERAIALDHTNAEALLRRGSILRQLGRDTAALTAYQQALAIEPAMVPALLELGILRHAQRRFDEAARWLDSAVSVEPALALGFVWRSHNRLNVGDTAGARADAEAALRLGADDPVVGEGVLALLEARRGDTAAARARLDRLLGATEVPTLGYLPALQVSAALVALGD